MEWLQLQFGQERLARRTIQEGASVLALVLGVIALLVAAVEAVRARMAGRNIRWWIVLVAGFAGMALLWLWWTYLRFPLVHPVG